MKQIFRTIAMFSIFGTTLLTACTPALAPVDVLTGSSQIAWVITSRVENGGAPSLPVCAKDDSLVFKKGGKFESLIAGTQCNPSEVEVKDGTYALSGDNKVITFTVPGFSYTGKLLEYATDKLVIEFDLGPGFTIKDTFAPKK
jgi:Lipocalin-like domain